MGYRRDHITVDLDERDVDFDFDQYVKTLGDRLVEQGREVSYKRNRKFIIDVYSLFLRAKCFHGELLHKEQFLNTSELT
jgi:hypothetical protein